VRIVATQRDAILALFALTFARILELPFIRPGFVQGPWQNDLVRPFLFISLICVHKTIISDGVVKARYAVTTIVLGIAGLHQLTMTGFTVLIVGICFIYKSY
jgi:hypothetical protein